MKVSINSLLVCTGWTLLFETWILLLNEVVLKGLFDCVILVLVVFGEIKRAEDVICLISHCMNVCSLDFPHFWLQDQMLAWSTWANPLYGWSWSSPRCIFDMLWNFCLLSLLCVFPCQNTHLQLSKPVTCTIDVLVTKTTEEINSYDAALVSHIWHHVEVVDYLNWLSTLEVTCGRHLGPLYHTASSAHAQCTSNTA